MVEPWLPFSMPSCSVAGYAYRRRLIRGSRIPDLLLALLEDLVAVGGGFLLLSHL